MTTTTDQRLPQLTADTFLTDGGIETSLIYGEGIALPDFAAFVLLDDELGRAAIDRYFHGYAEIASRDGVGLLLETATWRASADWGARLGYDAASLARVNRDAVQQLQQVRDRFPGITVVVSGCVGPRGDGYVVGETMSSDEAAAYHAPQAAAFAEAGADLITAITMTYADEAVGVARAAQAAGLPCVIAFTVETDGRLPSGETLQAAVEAVDAATNAYPAYFMINCAHPTHFEGALQQGAAWTQRIGGIRANASRMSHAELDAATELDAGDPAELAAQYASLRASFPTLRVLGGCCGTDHRHLDAISRACAPQGARQPP